MQTGQKVGVVEDVWNACAAQGCSTWNTRRLIGLHVPRGTSRETPHVQNEAQNRDGRPCLIPKFDRQGRMFHVEHPEGSSVFHV